MESDSGNELTVTRLNSSLQKYLQVEKLSQHVARVPWRQCPAHEVNDVWRNKQRTQRSLRRDQNCVRIQN
jgi:hypothetical protein